jgi:hypothetical protein
MPMRRILPIFQRGGIEGLKLYTKFSVADNFDNKIPDDGVSQVLTTF